MINMDINNLKQIICGMPACVIKNVIAVYIYGSIARGDHDLNSDCDVLICVNNCDIQEYNLLKTEFLKKSIVENFEFSFYQLNILEEMQKKGSYFLWHIKKEGILVYRASNIFDSILEKLPPYTGTFDDLCEYKDILKDVKESIELDEVTIIYELSVLATLARNTCIACCYIIGVMDFGRNSPIIKASAYLGEDFPFTLNEYINLYDYRLHVVRNKRIEKDEQLVIFVQNWVNKIDKLLNLVLKLEVLCNGKKQ